MIQVGVHRFGVQLFGQSIEVDDQPQAEAVEKMLLARMRVSVVKDFDTKKWRVRMIVPMLIQEDELSEAGVKNLMGRL